MKYIFTTAIMLFVFALGYGKQIDSITAKTIAQNLIYSNTSFQARPTLVSMQLYYKSVSEDKSTVYYYVFNTNPTGFVIIAGDDNVTPVLGYSTESIFDTTRLAHQVSKWLERYRSEIRYVITNKILANSDIQNKWQTLLSPKNKVVQQSLGISSSVSPLVKTLWDQSPDPMNQYAYYNTLCPFDSASGQRTVTGCVATAMAQVMKYWNYPAHGEGIRSYEDNSYGRLSANFGNTTYQWDSMPIELSKVSIPQQINAVSTLMYDAGVSVFMIYGVDGSGARASNIPYALQHDFTYSNTVRFVIPSLVQSDWIDTLETELNAGRPIIYGGEDSSGTEGHCFVLDGYDASNLFHVNWGWSGLDNGYFQIGLLNPDSLGTGGGSGGYNSDNQAIIGIQPPINQQTYNLGLYSAVTPTDSTIGYNAPFSIRTNIINNGTNNFSGDIAALVFDASFNFVDSLTVHYGESLQSGYIFTNGLTFSTTGKLSMLPGKYYVAVYYRPVGGDWIIVNNGSYNNLSEITVVNYNSIALNSPIAVTPTNLIEGQSISTNLNIVNNGSSTFFGQYQVDLYNLDGTLAQEIGTVTESNGLPSTYTYVSPYLNFSNSVISVSPGSYYLAVSYLPTGGSWQLAGTGSYQNPIKVNIQPVPLLPDKYEPNDTITQAYDLPLVFSGNSSNVNTSGSNFNTSTDNDYYKIVLPIGYDYTVNARLDDSYSSNNDSTYTVDATFAYSINDTLWSDYFDDVMPNNIIAHGGDTLYFYVTHYFIGSSGTYLLNMNITRTPTTISWIGITNTDWNTATNWSTGLVPYKDDDVIVNTGTPFSPVINSGVIGSCKSIHVNSTSALTISTGGNLIITGH